MENLLYCALGALALPFRYYLSETQACKLIGVEISETGTETGFQNAISIPSSTSMSLATWALIIGVIVYLAYEYGWGALGIGVLVFWYFCCGGCHHHAETGFRSFFKAHLCIHGSAACQL